MASNQKLKILYVMKILLEQSDEEHVLSAAKIADILEKDYDMTADRKGIYNDVLILEEFGLDVNQKKGTNPGYYIGARDFEVAELKLLVDAVSASKFISGKKTKELIKKIEKLTSKYNEKQLDRQVYIDKRTKTENEGVYINVDCIHNAIASNTKITFKYVQWTPDGKLEYRRGGEFYEVSPWALTWDDQNYYLVAYDSSDEKIKYYRVDKMRQIGETDKKREGQKLFKDFDLAMFAKKTFGMYEGKEEKVTLVCDNSLCGVIFDRFGKDAFVKKEDDKSVKVTVTVAASPQFFGWLTGLGANIKIASPESVKDEYKSYLKSIQTLYK